MELRRLSLVEQVIPLPISTDGMNSVLSRYARLRVRQQLVTRSSDLFDRPAVSLCSNRMIRVVPQLMLRRLLVLKLIDAHRSRNTLVIMWKIVVAVVGHYADPLGNRAVPRIVVLLMLSSMLSARRASAGLQWKPSRCLAAVGYRGAPSELAGSKQARHPKGPTELRLDDLCRAENASLRRSEGRRSARRAAVILRPAGASAVAP